MNWTDLREARRWWRRRRRQIDRSLSILGAVGGTVGVVAGLLAWRTSVAARRDAFEPIVVVSRFEPTSWERKDHPNGMYGMVIKTGKLWLKNVGRGDAFEVGCHVVNPFSEKHQYFRFRSADPAFMTCDGESLEEDGFRRTRRYTRVLTANEEQELCIQGLDIDQTLAEFFLVVRCAYLDKEGSIKGGDEQEIELGSYTISTAEGDTPAREIIHRYLRDPRVARRKQLIPQPKPRTVTRPE